MIGQTISHYKILEKLWECGMSQTFPRSRFIGRVDISLRIPLESASADRSGRREL